MFYYCYHYCVTINIVLYSTTTIESSTTASFATVLKIKGLELRRNGSEATMFRRIQNCEANNFPFLNLFVIVYLYLIVFYFLSFLFHVNTIQEKNDQRQITRGKTMNSSQKIKKMIQTTKSSS